MNDKERARLAYDQQSAGLQYGADAATALILRFPDGVLFGLSSEASDFAKSTLDQGVSSLLENGLSEDITEVFAGGYWIGVRNALSNYADDHFARAFSNVAK
jgi:hypothetical protein